MKKRLYIHRLTCKQQDNSRVLALLVLFLLLPLFLSAKRIYVSPAGSGDGTSWATSASLHVALQSAIAGDEIWLRGSEVVAEATYSTTTGFVLPAGVSLYGGFKGDETQLSQREVGDRLSRMRYHSILSGTTVTSGPGSTANAPHVLIMPLSGAMAQASRVNGLMIVGGYADGTETKGGGIFVSGIGHYIIERCFFANNYGVQGGAIYVSPESGNHNNNTSLISYCELFNNAAGIRSEMSNSGGGIYLAGKGTITNCSIYNNEKGGVNLSEGTQMINCTLTHNTGGAVDMINANAANKPLVANCIVWENSYLSHGTLPQFFHCAAKEFAPNDSNGNIKLSDKNNNPKEGPLFILPSSKMGFDRTHDWAKNPYPVWRWEPLYGSPLIDGGENARYDMPRLGTTDLENSPRISNGIIDIGSYEFEPIPQERRRYVKAGAKGDGLSWATASGDLQAMIDQLAENNPSQLDGEVWVAEGEYVPTKSLVIGTAFDPRFASFRMRDGIHVYGGFAGIETNRSDRVMASSRPWDFKHKTILRGYRTTDPPGGVLQSWQEVGHRWVMHAGNSAHVVWFAHLPAPDGTIAPFKQVTVLDGVTVMGGNGLEGNAHEAEAKRFHFGKGAGLFMGVQAELRHSIVHTNVAQLRGGGAYLQGGEIFSSLLYNNGAGSERKSGRGGAVYMEGLGIVLRSALVNNAANNGGAIYMEHTDARIPETYMILSTSLISNNTSSRNGAILCDQGGVVLQSTIVNNYCPMSQDATDDFASRTGGIYLFRYGWIINTVLWNNRFGPSQDSRRVPMYARETTPATARFYHTAASGLNNSIWVNVQQKEMVSLTSRNHSEQDGVISPEFDFSQTGTSGITPQNVETLVGVQPQWKQIDYFWPLANGSNLRAMGLELGSYPSEIVLSPQLDLMGAVFDPKPTIGASHAERTQLNPEKKGNVWRLYVDGNCTTSDHDGSSWNTGYRSLNEAIEYFAQHSGDPDAQGKEFEIYVLEGTIHPKYGFSTIDPRSATIRIPRMLGKQKFLIKGGFSRDSLHVYDPMRYRTIIDGNERGVDIKEGHFHNIVLLYHANVEIAGFHVINGYADKEATVKRGAGLLMSNHAKVVLRDCVFENNTAVTDAAIGTATDANSTDLTLINCVVNNNTNTGDTDANNSTPVVTSSTTHIIHSSFVNNWGKATGFTTSVNSYSAGNLGYNSVDLPTWGAEANKHFLNPTLVQGATLGFQTYYGGYSNFTPLTSSMEASAKLINKGQVLADPITDLAQQERFLGGKPDLGAYEASLPGKGSVIYVRTNGDDRNDGYTWDTALASVYTAVQRAKNASLDPTKRPQVWVAAGIYSRDAGPNELSCYLIEEGVQVYGGFPKTGNPGMKDRHPLVSQYISNPKGQNPADYETILQPLDGWDAQEPTIDLSSQSSIDAYKPKRNRVLAPSGDGTFTVETVWDGFTIQHGWFDCTLLKNPGEDGVGGDGAAGVKLWENMVIRNSVIRHNKTLFDKSKDGGIGWRAAGVFCSGTNKGGSIVNCYLLDNRMNAYELNRVLGFFRWNYSWKEVSNAGTAYGAGAYVFKGTVYNCVIAGNRIAAKHADGAGVFLENATFFNNTIVQNESVGTTRASGGVAIYQDIKNVQAKNYLKIYNCIIGGNSGNKTPEAGNQNVAVINGGGIHVYNSISDVALQDVTLDKYVIRINNSTTVPDLAKLFVRYQGVKGSVPDFRLTAINEAVNKGLNEATDLDQNPVVLLDYTDMDFTDRIKDCTVDIGAFERTNSDNVRPDAQDIFYVTIDGCGLADGSSPQNAACRMKLQEVLNKAGELVKQGRNPIVKLAGYTGSELNNDNVYWANTLSNPNDPQSYTHVIPYGVTLLGGYNPNGVATQSGWEDPSRDAFTYRTILSPLALSDGQLVNGYHAIEFGEKPAHMADKTTLVDGISLQGGKATSLAGNGHPGTRGGGAIVPAWGHIRNCIIRDNTALEGGGLYLMPGALVSGCLIVHNKANIGAGIYMKQDAGATDAQGKRSHAISCSVANNVAVNHGGGIYLEDYAGGMVNAVIGGNKASSGNNISGMVDNIFVDDLLKEVLFDMSLATGDTSLVDSHFYPFNNCFVEAYQIPGIFQNEVMTRDSSIYVTESFRLRAFSPLINSGPVYSFQTSMEKIAHISAYDMQGYSRLDRRDKRMNIDVGAFAYAGGNIPMPKNASEVVRRIFVSANTSGIIDETKLAPGTEVEDYLGRSFYTSLSHIDDALEYIKLVRALKDPVGATERFSTIKFEIWVAAGVYKPFIRRMDASHHVVDQRLNSFVVPSGVKIFGGFSGLEYYGYQVPDNKVNLDGGQVIQIDNISTMQEAIIRLDRRDFIDMNGNALYEPWELKEQTILSGNINQSSKEKNVYHVVYSYEETPNPELGGVYLDGLIIQDGETLNKIVVGPNSKEIGFGGGIYSYNVDYTISQCRLLHNRAMRGGAIYVRSANLKLFGSLIAGNGPTRDLLSVLAADEPRGGAVYVTNAGSLRDASLFAANNLWTNNECAGNGGALGVSVGQPEFKAKVNLINNTFVCNKAQDHGAIFLGNHVTDVRITNCAFWGNEVTMGSNKSINHLPTSVISHSAFDEPALRSGLGNIYINEENMALDGPRFKAPAPVAGMYGYSARSHWNPVAISVLVDQGDGRTQQGGSQEIGAYKEWWNLVNNDYKQIYVKPSASGQVYKRYAGPRESYTPNGVVNRDPDQIIDIGFYEYQHPMEMNQLDHVFVAPVEKGTGSGRDWHNATSNLQAALSAMTHPAGGIRTDKHIYVKSGQYAAAQVADGIAAYYFHGDNRPNSFLHSVTLHGSCTGIGTEQDFSKPTIIKVSDANPTSTLLDVENNGYQITIEGVTLLNDGTPNEANERGLDLLVKGTEPVILKQVAVRNNSDAGIYIDGEASSSGVVKMANVLFADGGTGLQVSPHVRTLVTNATFANNRLDVLSSATAKLSVFNSVSWNTTNTIATDAVLGNVSISKQIPNMHIDGPNFVKPESQDISLRDYSIRPSRLLLNKGIDQRYKEVLDLMDVTTERDLANKGRFKGQIDVGAYEFASDMQKIIYVKQGVIGSNNSGVSWEHALSDLQSAINLASIYSSNQSSSTGVDTGFVFVDKGVTAGTIETNMPNVKVYGGMNGETTTVTDPARIPSALLAARKGLLENDRYSTIASLILSSDVLIDGFDVGNAILNKGVLSTSLVNSHVTGTSAGLLYNSLVYGTVEGCEAVNVTATGLISSTQQANCIVSAQALPASYLVDRYWRYQLKEDNPAIDAGTLSVDHYIQRVGHAKDIAGNRRVRGRVDNGAFETWMIRDQGVVSESDYPHGKSVLYVSPGKELSLDASLTRYTVITPFNPGFMLLMHGAELLGNGQPIRLTNVAVERNVPANGFDMAYLPYSVDQNKTKSFIQQQAPQVRLMRYDGNERAKHTYIYSPQNSIVWKPGFPDLYNGVLLDNTQGTAAAKVRFYGSYYEENMTIGGDKFMLLKQYNYTNWSDMQEQRFTHKENMGWNLVGSPYLHSMDLSDMEYARVVYTLAHGGSTFQTLTVDAEGFSTGKIASGSGFLTQTATLQESEVIHVKAPVQSTPSTFNRSGDLVISMAPIATSAEESSVDVIELTAVPTPQASATFNVATDGVKWMGLKDDFSQLYMERCGGRYSLLAAVEEDATLALGVRVGSSGNYRFSIPQDVPAYKYDRVILYDRYAGKSVDLKQEDYPFHVMDAGEQSGRFELRLNGRLTEGVNSIRAYRLTAGRIRVDGLPEKALVQIYDLSGRLISTRVAGNCQEDFLLPGYLVVVEVVGKAGNRLFSEKVSVR